MPGHGELGERLLPAEYAIRASTRAAFLEQGSKAPFVLTVRLQQKLRQLSDIRRNPPRLGRMYAARGLPLTLGACKNTPQSGWGSL